MPSRQQFTPNASNAMQTSTADLDESDPADDRRRLSPRTATACGRRTAATVNATIHGFEGIHSDIVPVLVEMLQDWRL